MERGTPPEAQRAWLLNYLNSASDKKVGALFTLLGEDGEANSNMVGTGNDEWDQLEEEWTHYQQGEIQAISWDELRDKLASRRPTAEDSWE